MVGTRQDLNRSWKPVDRDSDSKLVLERRRTRRSIALVLVAGPGPLGTFSERKNDHEANLTAPPVPKLPEDEPATTQMEVDEPALAGSVDKEKDHIDIASIF